MGYNVATKFEIFEGSLLPKQQRCNTYTTALKYEPEMNDPAPL